MKRIVTWLLMMVFVQSLCAQIGMGRWRTHISPKAGVQVAYGNNAVYIALQNGLLEYDLTAGEKTLRTAADYLSDNTLTAVHYHNPGGRLYIGYSNGNIDLLRHEEIRNLNAIVVSNVAGSRRINNIKSNGSDVFLATGFGIVVVNDSKTEVRDTYYPTGGNQGVVDIAFSQDSIYALTRSGLFVGALTNNFLADPAQWRQASYVPNYSVFGAYKSIEIFNEEVFISYNDDVYSSDTLFKLNTSNYTLEPFLVDLEINRVTKSNNQLLVAAYGGLIIFDDQLIQNQVIFQYNHGAFPVAVDGVYAQGNYYIADEGSGLVKAPNPFNTQQIGFEGPDKAFAFRTVWESGTLVVAGGPSDRAGYAFRDEKWTSFNMADQALIQTIPIPGFISTAVNQRDPNNMAFGSFSDIPLAVIRNGQVISDTFSIFNSPLEVHSEAATSGLNWSRISDMRFDRMSNLWVLNSHCNRPLKVLLEDGTWSEYDLGTVARNRTTRRLAIDNNGVKWMTIDGAGVVAYDDNDTPQDVSDDRLRVLNSGENSGALPTTTVEALAVDLDNNIWVGTPEGMRVLYNSRNVFDASPGQYNFQRLLIEFGENVEIVLGTTHITAIQVDGANRKWIGTANAGVFLFSSDGLTMIENFTRQNSPLLSNQILDISIDQLTGEVYFVTDEGMISYRADASRGDNNYTNVTVFPNPVYPDYFGPITIQGIAANSEVKITDIAGNLVYRTASNGGTATWDGNTVNGQRVATGVYLIWTSVNRENEKGRKVGKVLVIN